MNITDLPSNRAFAKSIFSKYYYTGKICKNGHISVRQTNNGTCIDCNRGYALNHYHNNSESRIKKVTEYQILNSDKVKQWSKQHYINYKQSFCDRASIRYILKKKQTPKWLTILDQLKIIQFYKERDRLNKLTGINFHVDHMVPLQGKTVSGLHVPWNLQILTSVENVRKSNKLLKEYI